MSVRVLFYHKLDCRGVTFIIMIMIGCESNFYKSKRWSFASTYYKNILYDVYAHHKHTPNIRTILIAFMIEGKTTTN